jgi:hypothetical protein
VFPHLSLAISPAVGFRPRTGGAVPPWDSPALPRAPRTGHRLQPVSAGLHFSPGRRARPPRIPGGIHRVLPPSRERHYRCRIPDEPLHRCLSAESASGRPAASGEPRGPGQAGAFLTSPDPALLARGSILLGERSHITEHCRCRVLSPPGRAVHVARTCPSSPFLVGKCNAAVPGMLGMHPVHRLHADARVSF